MKLTGNLVFVLLATAILCLKNGSAEDQLSLMNGGVNEGIMAKNDGTQETTKTYSTSAGGRSITIEPNTKQDTGRSKNYAAGDDKTAPQVNRPEITTSNSISASNTIAPSTVSTVSPPTTPNTTITTTTTTTNTTNTTITTTTTMTTVNATNTTTSPTTPVQPEPTQKSTSTSQKSTVTSPTPIIETSTQAIPKDRRFDGPSFIGGIVLSVGTMAISFVAFKFYKARTERNYHTL